VLRALLIENRRSGTRNAAKRGALRCRTANCDSRHYPRAWNVLTPTFVWNKEVFYGADRLDVLAWKIAQADL
jgi:hypothetical protein